ncbi:MAG: amidohydrolase [Planctomycetaceae bacterium]
MHRQKLNSKHSESLAHLWQPIVHATAQRESAWIEFRRRLHRAPEPSGHERHTSQAICEQLKAAGIAATIPERGVGAVANFALGHATNDSPTIALRADIDALRMNDQKTTAYASQKPGLAHTCGHDVHTTIMCAAAELLNHLQSTVPGEKLPAINIRLLFQAAEESCQGALWMIEDGMLENVDCILGLHVEPQLPVGQIGICYGTLTAQVDEVHITLHGIGGHTARPHNTTDPIAAAAMLITTLHQMLPRTVDVRDASVFSFGTVSGGTASNVIPDRVQLSGTLRTTDRDSREKLMERIRLAVESVASLTGNEIALQFAKPLGSVRNSQRPTSAFELAGRQVLGDAGIVLLTRPSMGGEDFAMYLDHVPGSQIRLGCAGNDHNWPLLHSPVFDVDEATISIGARVVALTTLLLG